MYRRGRYAPPQTEYIRKCCESMVISCAFWLGALAILALLMWWMETENYIHRQLAAFIDSDRGPDRHTHESLGLALGIIDDGPIGSTYTPAPTPEPTAEPTYRIWMGVGAAAAVEPTFALVVATTTVLLVALFGPHTIFS